MRAPAGSHPPGTQAHCDGLDDEMMCEEASEEDAAAALEADAGAAIEDAACALIPASACSIVDVAG